jgi:hypothetical protein
MEDITDRALGCNSNPQTEGALRAELALLRARYDHGTVPSAIFAMTLRRRLPQRRGAIAVELEHAGHHFRMQIGCFPDGVLGEVFIDAAKPNSTLDAFAADAAILVSLLLQHGATPAEIGHALRRAPDGAAASLIGAVVDRLAEMEPQS